MSAEYPHKPNSGVLFGTSEKWRAGTEGRPERAGEVNVVCLHCGKENRLRVGAWNKVGKKAREFLALSFKQPQQNGGSK